MYRTTTTYAIHRRLHHRGAIALLAVALLAAACSDDGSSGGTTAAPVSSSAPATAAPTSAPAPDTTGVADSIYRATITYTQYGIPHITADSLGSAFFGQGWAMAHDHLCTIVDQIVKVRGERSKYHGAGADDSYLHSDLVYKALNLVGTAQTVIPTLPQDAQDTLNGFAAGVSKYAADQAAGAEGTAPLPEWCDGAEWLGPITAAEVYAYVRDFALVGGTRNLIDYIATAAPPESTPEPPSTEPVDTDAASASAPDDADRLAPVVGVGSNAWSIGSEQADGANSILLANPHFPWEGELRFWESHLTVPGDIDVYGTTPIGVPGVVIGFNDSVAWTRTVSAGRRFTGYVLTLDPADPTAYQYGDSVEKMEPVDVRVDVLQDGSIRTEQRTLWRSRYGLMVALPGGDWTAEKAYTVRDSNLQNDVMVQMVLAEMRAGSLDEFEQANRDFGGNPFANTILADASGEVAYIDTAVTPNLDPGSIARWEERKAADGYLQLLDRQRVTLLDGSDPRDEWIDDPAAAVPGTVPFDQLPELRRTDFVMNANDSYWLANPNAPQTGLSMMHGLAEVPQSSRTRMNLMSLTGGRNGDGTWTDTELWNAMLSNQGLEATLLREPVVERCRAAGGPDLQDVCDTLGAWNGLADLDAPGAVLWREFMAQFAYNDHLDAGSLWANGFDPADPINTPNGLAPAPADGPDPVITALAKAEELMATAGLALDATLGDTQYFLAGPNRTERIPVHGAGPLEGVENVVGFSPGSHSTEPQIPKGAVLDGSFELSKDGYPLNYGTSFLLAVAFTDEGPVAHAVLTYGQSGDLRSEFSRDQMELFSNKEWRDIWFRAADVAANVVGTPMTITM